MFLLGSADFVRRGLADGFADGRPGHAVLRGGDPVRQRLSRHVTEEEEEEEEVVVEVVGVPIKMSLAAAAAAAAAGRTRRRRRRRRVVPSARMGRLSRSKRRRWGWRRRRRRRRRTAAAAAAHTGEDPVGEFMRRANNQTKRRSHPKFTRWRKKKKTKNKTRKKTFQSSIPWHSVQRMIPEREPLPGSDTRRAMIETLPVIRLGALRHHVRLRDDVRALSFLCAPLLRPVPPLWSAQLPALAASNLSPPPLSVICSQKGVFLCRGCR